MVVAVSYGKGDYRDGRVESVSSVDADKGVFWCERLDLSVSIGEALVERCQNFVFGFQIAYLLGGRRWGHSGQLAEKAVVWRRRCASAGRQRCGARAPHKYGLVMTLISLGAPATLRRG